MTTAEPVIPSVLLQQKSYDVFHCVKTKQGFIGSPDVHEPFRFKLSSIEGGKRSAELADAKVEVSLHALGERIGMPLCSSHASSNLEWDEWVYFPVEIAELPLDALVCCTVKKTSGIVGGTSFYPFTSRGELKFGCRTYKLHLGKEADGSEDTTTRGHLPSAEHDLLARDYALDKIRKVDWMDGASMSNLAQANQDRCVEEGTMLLHVEFPHSSNKLPIFHLSVPTDFDRGANLYDQKPSPFVPYYDTDIHAENLAEVQAGVLSKSLHLISDADAQPAYRQRKQIMEIINRPPIQLEGLRVDDATLLWQFRYFLSKDPKGFVPFMQCVDWDSKHEREEAEKLIPIWKTIPVEDTLVLLSAQFRKIKQLRDYAISILANETDENMSIILLQLVQAIRYDVEDELADLLLDRCMNSWVLCSNFYWYVAVEVDLESSSPNTASVKLWNDVDEVAGGRYCRIKQALTDNLLNENCRFHQQLEKQEKLRMVLTNLYTTLLKEKDRTKKITMAKELIDAKSCGMKELFDPASLRGGEVLLPSHPNIGVYDIESEGVYMFKSAKMPIKVPFSTIRKGDVNDQDPPNEEGAVDFGVGAADTSINASDFNATTRSSAGGGGGAGGNASFAASSFVASNMSATYTQPPDESFSLIFKSGDDVRQDQLVIQFIELMNSLLKSNGLDLCLTPYKVLATSQNDGFLEVVADVETFQNVQKVTVAKYLQRFNTTPAEYQKAMDRFVKSCAGYCVITYVLGIGDRHLENLLITKDGRLLHIDFGFIFGYDPKPFPPPMKINKEMVDAIGGIGSEKYRQFKTYCCSAFNILRKHANLLLQLLLLMIDASIPHISGDSGTDPRLGIIKVQDKLRLDLNDAEATQYIQNVIADSVGALFTNLWDVIHEAAQAVRT